MTHRPTRVKRPGVMLPPWQRKTEVRPDASVVALLRATSPHMERMNAILDAPPVRFQGQSSRSVTEHAFKLDGVRGVPMRAGTKEITFSNPLRDKFWADITLKTVERARKQLDGARGAVDYSKPVRLPPDDSVARGQDLVTLAARFPAGAKIRAQIGRDGLGGAYEGVVYAVGLEDRYGLVVKFHANGSNYWASPENVEWCLKLDEAGP